MPIVKDKMANRFAFDYDARDGFIKNLAGGRLNGKSAIAFRNSTAWRMYNTSIDLVLDYQHDSYPGTSFRTEFPGFNVSTDPNAPASLDMGKGLFIHRNVGGGTLLINHSFNSNLTLSSITGVRAFNSDEKFDAYGTYELSQKGYGLCNFTLGWRYQPKKVYYEIGMFGKNIFDEKYIIDAGNSGRNIGFPTFIGGTRSVIGVQAKIGF